MPIHGQQHHTETNYHMRVTLYHPRSRLYDNDNDINILPTSSQTNILHRRDRKFNSSAE